MPLVDPTKLKQPLYRSKVKRVGQAPNIALEPDQFTDAEVLKLMKDSKIRQSVSTLIDQDYADVVAKGKAMVTALQRDEKITLDGGYMLFLESDTSWFLDQVTFIENHMRGLLQEFDPDRIKEIRETFEEKLYENIRASFLSRTVSVNLDIKEINDRCRSSAALYISQKFPDASAFTQFDLEYDVPGLYISPVPKGMTPEQQKAYDEKQQAVVMRIWSLIRDQYMALENRAAAGEFHDQNPGIQYVQSDIIEQIANAKTLAAEQKARIKEGLVPVTTDEVLASPNVMHQFSLASAKQICKSSGDLINRVTTAAELDLMTDPTAIGERAQILANLPIFVECAKNWIALNVRRSAKKANTKVSVLVDDDIQFSDEPDEEFIDEPIVIQTDIAVVADVQFADDADEPDDTPIEVATVSIVSEQVIEFADSIEDEDDQPIILQGLTPVSTGRKAPPSRKRSPMARRGAQALAE